MRKKILLLFLIILVVVSTAFIGISKNARALTGEVIEGFWYEVSGALHPLETAWTVGSSATRIAKGWFQDLDIAGVLTLGGTIGSGGLDMNGEDITNLQNVYGYAGGQGFIGFGYGVSSHSLTDTDDVVITGKLEANDLVYLDASLEVSGTTTSLTGSQLNSATRETKTVEYNFTAVTSGAETVEIYDYDSLMPNTSSAIIIFELMGFSNTAGDTDTYIDATYRSFYVKDNAGTVTRTFRYPGYMVRYVDGVAGGGTINMSTNSADLDVIGTAGKDLNWVGTVKATYEIIP